MHRALSLQAIARGADGIMQFQWRQSVAGAEKFHSAMLPHAGEDSRVFRETVALGEELAGLSEVAGARTKSRVAIVFEWDSWWAHNQEGTPSRVDYVRTVFAWYRGLWERGILVDFVESGQDLSGYDLVFAPATISLSRAARGNLAAFVRAGGELVVSYLTGILDEDLHVIEPGYLGELSDVLGIRVEEFAPPAEPSFSGGPVPQLAISGLAGGPATEWGEIVRLAGASVESTFVGGMLDGLPAITRHSYGEGTSWYVATAPRDLDALLDRVLEGIVATNAAQAGVEVLDRGPFRFVINHTANEIEVDGRSVSAGGATVVRR